MGTRQIDGIAPTFAKKPSIRQEDDGRRLLFECRILADPKPVISWFHNEDLVEAKGRFKVNVDKDGNSYHSILEIKDVTVEDAGKYKVTAKNELGESNATISLNFDSDEAAVPAEGAKPTFTEKPVIRQSDDFNKIIFECKLVADPKPTIEWHHAGAVVKEGGRHKYVLVSDKHNHIVSLEITKVEAKDGGEYKVVAKNKHGESSANINLNFEGKTGKPKIPDGKAPRFPKKPTIKQEDDALILECILEANPFPEITWYHGTKKLSDGARHKTLKKELSKDTYLLALDIRDPTTEDGGNYRCNAMNDLGESNANIALNFQGGDSKEEGDPPTFIQKPKIIPKEGGSLIVMECRVRSSSEVTVTWFHGTTLVRETNRIKSRVKEEKEEEYYIVLEIRDPSKEDGGQYKCNIKNEDGEINANLNLNIEGDKTPAGDAPSFVEKPKIIPEDGGKRIIMECKVRAKPKPEITWYREKTVVKETTRIKQTITEEKDVYIIRMELRDPELTDAGIYKCNVKNSAGESNANLTLNIELAPVIKERPRVVRRERHEKIVIECHVQSAAPPQVTWYKETNVVKQDSRRSVQIKEVSKGDYLIALEIDKPSDTDKGTYKLMAKNEKGEVTSPAIQVDFEEPPEEKKKEPEKKKEEPKKEPEKKPAGEKPKLLSKLQSQTVEEGKMAEFICKIESKEKATITWKRNKTVIRESRETRIEFDGSTARLVISKTTKEFSGTYTCEIVNSYGKEETSAELTVTEPPKKKPEKKEEEKPPEKKAEKPPEKKEEKKLSPPKIEEPKPEPEKKKIVKKKSVKDKVPEISIEVPQINEPKRPSEPEFVVREPTPEPGRKGSVDSEGSGSRRGSLLSEPIMPLPTRRGSIIILADEKGMAVDETGKSKKLRPGEMLEIRNRRQSSVDMRRASVTDLGEIIDKPSTPLRPMSDEGPPSIIDYQDNVTAVETATAYITVQVEGNPAPEMRFFKGITEIYEGGRYKIVTDGDTNTVALCIRKSKSTDEGKYKVMAFNKHGEDSVNVSLFVSDESGMDFRAMLKHRQYAKWGRDKEEMDWALKAAEAERRPSLKETKKPDLFIKPLESQHVKEGKEKKVRFEAVFSKTGVKAKWFKNKQELFLGKKYHMTSQGDLHVLEIMQPVEEDSARITVQCLDTVSSASLEVDAPDPVYKFTRKLPPRVEQYTTKEAILECTVNNYRAQVKWYKGNKQIEGSDRYIIESDPLGRKILKILDCVMGDAAEYSCKISPEEKTSTKLIITEQQFEFTKQLKSLKVMEKETITLECEVDEWEAKVKWFKGDKEITPADKRYEMITEGRKRRLIMKNSTLADEAEYTCKTNSDKTKCEVIVEPANKFMKKLKDTNALERDQIVLEVELLDQKAPLQWFKNGVPVKPTDRINVKMFDNGKHHLIINNAQMDDTGDYSCESKELTSACKLTVGEAEKKPIIKLDKTDFAGDAGKPLVIEVPYLVTGTRTSDVVGKLMRGGQPVSNKECDIAVKNDMVVITFKKTVRATSDVYEFSLSNSQGEAKTKLNVNIQDVPTPPQGPLEVFDVFRDRCKLSWKPPLDTGGMPLKHYLVERQDLGVRGGWTEVGTTEDIKYDVTDLVHKKEYKFRVRAVNQKGASDPLVAPKTTLAKDPYDEPSKPGSVEVTDWDKDHVDLKWVPPEKDGGAPITAYVIEYKDKFSLDWNKALEVPADQTKARVENLKEGVQYEFRVRAVNKAGPGEPSDPTKPIIVKARFVKPYIIGDELKNVIVKKGQVIKYDINFGGEPPPEVKWELSGKEIFASSRITIDKTNKSTTITIRNSERADSGKMSLILTNGSGTCTSTADVIVLDKPTPPLGPLEVEEVYAEHAKIAWKKPKDTGGQDLKGYVIEKMDMDTGRWVPAVEVGPNATGAKIEGLTPKKKYKFRVKAVNKEGESEPLEIDKPILAKNPYDEPSKPGKPEIVDYDNTHVDLKWAAPESDGGRPISHYVVEMKDKFNIEWTEVKKTEDNKPEVSVTGLKENMVCQFRVKAVNIAGPGEPSEPTSQHVVKHRNLKPYIDRTNLKVVIIKVGRSHKFEVDVRGEPPPELVWTFAEGVKLKDDDHIKIENKDYHTDLSVTKATRKQSGKYTITATNANGKDTASVDLTVLGKPSMPEGPLEVSDVHKEGAKLKWKKPKDDGGLPIKEYEIEKLDKETGRWTRCGKSDKPEFDVQGLTPGKEYLFRVAAINDEGDSEPLVTLEPIIAKNPYDEPSKPGTPELVDWDNASVDLKWEAPKKDGGAPITKYIIEKKEKFGLNWEKAIEVAADKTEGKVTDLKERQEYQFRVVAVNEAGPGEPSDPTQNHLVKHRRLKPYIDRTNLDCIMVKKGKPIKLDVNVRGEPAPKITWMLKDKPVVTKDNVEVINVDYNTKLNINDSQRINTGLYKIIAENESGRDEAEVEIVVLGAPSRPGGPLEVSDVTAKGCKLKWKKPEDDGGKPIQHYVVEKLDPLTGNWVPVGRADKDQTEMPITGLTPGKDYQFRVKAVNAEGESEPLVTDRPITAKNPYDEPGAPGTPVIDDWDENHVDLKWDPPKKDGGAPISGYVIEKKERFGGGWEKCLETDSPAPKAKVADLVKGQQYQFRVRAVNKAGPGEPSEPTNQHIAKARYLKPRINRDNLQPITIRAGQIAKLDVEVEGEPPPKISWAFAGKELEPNEKVKIENEDYQSHLRMNNVTRKQSGKYTILAENESGKDQADVDITVLDKPGKPEGPLEVSDVHAKGCKLNWNKPKDDGGLPLEGYVVEKMDAATNRWVPVGKIPKDTTEHVVTGLEPGKKYQFRVKAVNEEGESEPLETDRTTLAKNPYDQPGPPGVPKVDDYDKDFVKLKWDPPTRDGGAPITGYVIEKKDKYSNNWLPAAEIHGNTPEGKVTGLNEGDKYEFRVRAVNKAGPGEPSEASVPHIAKPKNLKPKIDRTNLKNMSVKVGQAINFDVDIIGEPPPTVTWKHQDKELQSGEVYRIDNIDYNSKFFLLRASRKETGIYTITATNRSGSDEAQVEILVLGKPSPPNGPLEVSNVHKEGCSLKWKEPDDDGGAPIDYYEVEKMDEETGMWVPAGKSKTPQFEINNLIPGKKYKFRVRACNKEGDSEELETDHSTLAKNPFDEPGKPGRPEPTDWDKDHVDLKWSPPASDGGSPITDYIIEKRKKGAHKWQKAKQVPGDKTTATVSDLEEGEEYEFRVMAVNKGGPGEPSEASRPVVAKPRNLSPYIDRTNLKDITIRSGQALKFDVDVKGEPAPTITWQREGVVLKTGDNITIDTEDYHTLFVMTKCKRKDTGNYTITAKNATGVDEVTVKVTVIGKPGKPKGPLKVSDVHAEGCKLKWDKPEDDGGEPIQQYVIEKMDTDTGRWVPVMTSKEPEAEITGLVPGKEYKFRVKAVNPEGESEPLETDLPTLAKNPYDEPTKPGKPTAKDWDKHHVDLAWKPPEKDGGAPVTSYIIEKKDKYSTKWQKATEIIGDKCEARVPDLIEGMEYQFRVRAVNKAGPSAPSDASDVVIAKARHLAPKIDRSTLKNVTIHAGQGVKFDARVIGEPPPKKTWSMGETVLKDGGHYSIEVEDYRIKLLVHNAERKDTGTYTLKAQNDSGKDEATVELTVLDKPSPPGGPLEVSDIHAEGCKLKWNPPADDGGQPLEHYTVEKLDPETGRWMPVGRTTKPEMEIKNLTPGQEYKFRVRAVNPEGESEPLEAEKPIIAKNPFDQPGKPGVPELKDYDKDHVDLKWTPPIKDGGAPIVGYIVEKKEKDGTKWVKAAQVDGKDCEVRVPDLILGEAYQFRVKAINAAGPGEPSDATKPIVVKHKKLAPKIDRRNLKPVKIKAGQAFAFDVKVAGEPPPSIAWKIKDRPVVERPTLTIKNVPYNTKLDCEKAERKDAGTYWIIATNQYGEDQAEVEVEVLSKPSKPEGPLEVSDVNKNGCKLKWNKPKDDGGEPLDGYVVEKRDPDTGAWIPIGKTHNPEMTVDGLTPGKAYDFRVKAVNKEGESEPLVTLGPTIAKDPFETPTAPGKPEPTDWNKDHVDLKWTPPDSDGGSPITHYIIEKKEKNSPKWEKAAEVPGDQCKGTAPFLDEGKEYEFRVVPVNKAGPGEPSQASVPVIAKPRFLAPHIDRKNLKDLTVKAGQMIKYDVNVTGEPPPTIIWALNDETLKSNDKCQIDNVDYNTKLTVRRATRADCGKYTITATNSSGKDSVTVTVNVLDKPTAPEGPLEVSDVHKDGCKLKWKRPKDNGGMPIDCYEVEKMDPETGIWVPVGKTKEPGMDVTGLTPGKDYKFRVRAVNKEGESAPLETDKAITAKNPFDEPGKPGNAEVTDWDKDHVDLKWTPPTEDGGSPITGYIVEKKDKYGDWEKALEVPPDQTKCTVPNLMANQPYEFRIKAVNKAGPGEPSDATLPVVTKPRKLAPKIDRTNLQKVRIKAGQSFNFDVNVIGEPPPTKTWTLKGKKLSPSDHVKLVDEPYNTKLVVRQAKREDSGTYTLTAVNDHGKDQADVEVVVIDKPAPPGGPLKVNDVHAEGCTLKWNAPVDDGGLPIDHYVIEKQDPASGIWVPAGDTIGPETSFKVKGLQQGKPYKFRVRAANRQGESDPLEADKPIIAKNPFDEPGKPGTPEIEDFDKDFVKLKWTAPETDGGSPITGYVIEKKDKYNPDWVPCAEVPADQTKGKVPDLIEGNEYEFRVRAVNKGGPGVPSDATPVHRARPRNSKI